MPKQLPVRVWLARKKPALTFGEFFGKLREHFVPATIYLMTPLGLHAYFPTLCAASEDQAGLPHESALVFYESIARYEAARATDIGRGYARSHADVFDKAIHSGFPELWVDGSVSQGARAYYGPDADVDWNTGQTWALVMRWSQAPQPGNWAKDIQTQYLRVFSSVRQWVAYRDKNFMALWVNCARDDRNTRGSILASLTGGAAVPGATVHHLHSARDEEVDKVPARPYKAVVFAENETIRLFQRSN